MTRPGTPWARLAAPTASGAGEWLSPADTSNIDLDADDQVNAFLLAGRLGVGGCVAPDGHIDLEGLRAVVAERVADPAVRRFRERIARSGRRLAWASCRPDLAWHVRRVEPVAGLDGLAELCARLMTTPLPHDRPLWELLVTQDVRANRPCIVLRLHHAVADGVAGLRMAQHLFDAPDVAASSPPGNPPADPRGVQERQRRSLVTSVRRVGSVLRASGPRTVLLGPISAQRSVAFVDVEVAGLGRGARSVGSTVNDALLGAVAGAAGAMLRVAGQPVPAELTTSVPVALADRGASGNAVGVMLVRLPTGSPVPGRMARITGQTAGAKREARAQGTFELTRSRWGSRLFRTLARHQRLVALFVSNVRGPDQPLRLAGAPLERAWPLAPIQGNVRLGVTAFSHAGRLGCGVHVGTPLLSAGVFGAVLGEEFEGITALG